MKKVLIIEDDEIIRENMSEILALANYDVTSAANGKIGVEKARNEQPDLIICDIMMPELDGYGVIYLLSKDPRTSGIPFIFLTAKAEKSDIRKGMALGADDYLTKPFEEIDLLASVEGRLKRSEILKQTLNYTPEGIGQFIDTVHSISSLKDLYQDRATRKYKKKESIYHEGDLPQYLYFLAKGRIKTFKINADGKEFINEFIQSGEFFGYLPIMQNERFSEFAEAMEACEICRIPKEDFHALLKQDRDVANAFIKHITKSLHEKEERILSLAYDSIRKRTANALLDLQLQFCTEPHSEPGISITRSDLAKMVGTAPESVIRTLAEFKEDEMIKVEGKSIYILNKSALEGIW